MSEISSKVMDTLYEIEFQENGTRIETLCKMILYKEKDKTHLHKYLHGINNKRNIDFYACYNILKGCFAMREYHHFKVYLKIVDDDMMKRNMKLFYKLRNESKRDMIRSLLRCRPELLARTIFREKCYREAIYKLPTVMILMIAITNSTAGYRDFINKFILRRGDTYGCQVRADARLQ